MSDQLSFQLFSDIHLELLQSKGFPCIPPVSDHLILAGDIGKISMENFQLFIRYCSENWKTVIYVLGNHEFYGSRSMETILEKFKSFFSEFPNVFLLNDSSLELSRAGTIVYGFTGWTPPIFENTTIARESLNDYNRIRTSNGKWRVEDHREMSLEQLRKFSEFMESVAEDASVQYIIVVTHFPPVKQGTSNPIFQGDFLNAYFSWTDLLMSANLSSIAKQKIKVWCSGHTHWNYDFIQDGIRYVSNQIGYRGEDTGEHVENGYFNVGCEQQNTIK